jgi:hypothetical protein
VTGLFYALLSLIPLCIAVSGGFHCLVSACGYLLDFPCVLRFTLRAAVHPFIAAPVSENPPGIQLQPIGQVPGFRIIFVLLNSVFI